jgi:hypothetical protein
MAQIKKDNADMRKERQRLDGVIYSGCIQRHRSQLHETIIFTLGWNVVQFLRRSKYQNK